MSLWQKPEGEGFTRPATPNKAVASSTPDSEPRTSGREASIGQSVKIKGELTGNEDLTIDGTIDGRIVLKGHHLTIGPNGHITADVSAKSVQVNGEISGNINADDKVEIAPSGSVSGDICAPRVALADGSCFKGSIDMGGNKQASASSGSAASQPTREHAMSAGSVKS